MDSLSCDVTHYQVLDLPPDATRDEIRDSYRRLILDGTGTLGVSEALETGRGRLREALEVLNHPMRRAAYDRSIGVAGGAVESVSLEDIRNAEPPRLSTAEEARAGRLGLPEINDRARAAADAVARSYELRKQDAAAERALKLEAELELSEGPGAPVHFEAPVVEEGREQLPALGAEFEEIGAESLAANQIASRFQIFKEQGRRLRVMDLDPGLGEELRASGEFDGEVFTRLRERLGASLEDIVEITKINKRYLMAVEENDYGTLPGATYVKGFVGQYAEALGLDAAEVSANYMKRYHQMLSN